MACGCSAIDTFVEFWFTCTLAVRWGCRAPPPRELLGGKVEEEAEETGAVFDPCLAAERGALCRGTGRRGIPRGAGIGVAGWLGELPPISGQRLCEQAM